MIGALRSIANLIGVEAGNLAGSQVNGYKKKDGFMTTNSSGYQNVGNDFYTRTDYGQGALTPTSSSTDLAIQGKGMFVLFADTDPASFDPNMPLWELNNRGRFDEPITSGDFTVNGNVVSVDVNTDTFNDVLDKIGIATGGDVTAVYDEVHNSITLTNNTGNLSTIDFGASPTTNFLQIAEIDNSALQTGFNSTFKVSNNPIGKPDSERKLYFTRKGDFYFNDNGFLVNNHGLFVAGLDDEGKLIKIDKKTFDGLGGGDDIIHFSANGILFNDSQQSKEGKRLALAKFPNSQGLIGSVRGGDLYEATSAAGVIEISHPDRDDFGLLRDQALEESNVSPVDSLDRKSVV